MRQQGTPNYRVRSVGPDGFILHECGTSAGNLAEAQARACQLARSIMAAGPEGKVWIGWSVDVTNVAGRPLVSIPFAMA